MFLVAKRKANKNIRVDKPEVVKESNAIARAQLRPQAESVWEERIISQIVAFNRVDDEDFPEADFMLGRLVDGRKKISGYVFQQIGKAVERLASTTYTIYHSRKKYDIFPIFSRISYDNGIISAKLNPELKPYFLQLRREFSLRSLPEFRRLSSIYSQQLYRFLCSLRSLGNTEVPIERLHFTTTAPESLKTDFRKFRTRILEPAEKEINGKTGLKFRWEPIRQGRKVVAVRFIFNGGAAAEAVDRAAVSGDEELKKWQRLSNACYERHAKAGTTCKPRGGHKCTYCRTRGRMAFRGDTTE